MRMVCHAWGDWKRLKNWNSKPLGKIPVERCRYKWEDNPFCFFSIWFKYYALVLLVWINCFLFMTERFLFRQIWSSAAWNRIVWAEKNESWTVLYCIKLFIFPAAMQSLRLLEIILISIFFCLELFPYKTLSV